METSLPNHVRSNSRSTASKRLASPTTSTSETTPLHGGESSSHQKAKPPGVRRILIAEDNRDARDSLKELIEISIDAHVDAVANGEEALAALIRRPYSVLITDLQMPHFGGMRLIEEIQERRLPVTVIVTTGFGTVDEAVKAMRLGAYDFLTKPADPQRLLFILDRALKERALVDEVVALREQLQSQHKFQNILSKSSIMHEVFELIGHVADTSSTVLIQGETGTGKEQVARAIHQASAATRVGPLIAVNCAALPDTLLESELFGHEKGSFTGAVTSRVGRFEQAHGGTIFLDEVGDIPASMQVKLLRVLQERHFEKVGGGETIEVDVRVIGATNRSLEQLVKEGKFREDLFYRLNVVKIDLPPLRDRPEDIPLLATHFAEKYARPGQRPPQLTPETMEILLSFQWPGNVRQLENAIERACVTCREGMICPNNLPLDVSAPSKGKTAFAVDLSRPLPEQLSHLTAQFEERYFRKALRKTRGHIGRCAKLSGLSRRTITDKLAQYNIDKSEFKNE